MGYFGRKPFRNWLWIVRYFHSTKRLKSPYFLIRFPFFAILTGSIIYFLLKCFPMLIMGHIWVFFLFFLLLTPGIYFLAIYGSAKEGELSVWWILGSEILKMFFSLILAAVAIFKFHPEPRVFGLNFFILFILFSTFEIHCLIHNLRLQKKP